MSGKIAQRPAQSGVLLVDKPGGITSHTVVGRVRRVFGQREVGHTGTLDPMATGLMILALGRATRIARFIEATDKRYVGTVTLGRATTTYDAEGTTTDEAPAEAVAAISREQIEGALASLSGHIAQSVPAYSAVKVDGTRLYSRARRGEEFETPVRAVDVHELVATKIELPNIDIFARVSKGTYIRSLAVQIGEALGLPAHLSKLRRTHVGVHGIESAHALDALAGAPGELIKPEVALAHLPAVHLDPERATDVRHGRPLGVESVLAGSRGEFSKGDPVCLISPEGELLAVGIAELDRAAMASAAPRERALKYACVLSFGSSTAS